MRILIAGEFPAAPPKTVGGIQTVTWQLSAALARRGDAQVSALSVEKWLDSEARHQIYEHDLSAAYLRSPKSIPHVATAWTSDAWAVTRHVRRTSPDIVHAHGQVGYSVGAIRSGIPHVITVHGILKVEKASAGRPSPSSYARARCWESLEDWVLRKSQQIIVISPHVTDSITSRTSAELHYIPNPVDGAFHALERKPSDEPTLLSVGWLVPRKRQEILVRALATVVREVPEVKLRIVGTIPPREAAHAERLKSLIIDLGLQEVVSLESDVSQVRLLDLYSSAWLLVHSAIEESSPMAIAQALAAGLPVICTDIPGVRHLVSDGVNGYRDGICDDASLAHALIETLQSPSEVGRLSLRARDSALDSTADAVADRTMRVYEHVLGATQ